MVPRPFNYPLNVGNDICNINRIAWILRQQSARDRFIRKIFSRLEWPFIWKAFQRVSLSQSKPTIDTDHENRVSYTSGERDPAGIYSSRRSSPSWTLPDLSNSVDVLDPQFFNRAINDMKSPLGCLIHHIAGRWAAKEAVIKAHSYRKLFMHEISVIQPRNRPVLFSLEDAQNLKIAALVDPPCNTILMDDRVAKLRSLRGFSQVSQGLHKDKQIEVGSEPYFSRRSKVNESERQMARISISHDKGYATAVCIALDRPFGEVRDRVIHDDGEGLPLHEPSWGDEGWFDQDKVDHEEEKVPGYYRHAVEDVLNAKDAEIPYLD